MTPRYDQPVAVRELVIADQMPGLRPGVIPSRDYYYPGSPRVRRLTVVSYSGAPVRITKDAEEIFFELEDKALYDHAHPVETKEPPTVYHLRIHPEKLSGLEEGVNELKIHLPDGSAISYHLIVEKLRKEYAFRIVSLDVSHGNCALLCLPNGKNLLVDTGTERCAEEVIFPYLEKHGLNIDYCLITHHHADHDGSLEAVLDKYSVEKPDEAAVRMLIDEAQQDKRRKYLSGFAYLDNNLLCRYDRLDRIWDLGDIEITVLNSRYETNGEEAAPGSADENETSVSMIVHYKGFRYYHGADNYAPNQQRTLSDFSVAGRLEELECQYMQANHHFHGDMLPELIHAINPVAVIVPADQAIYSRSAFMVDYLQGVVNGDYPGKRLKETFISYTSGTVAVFVNSGEEWHYETY